MATSVVREWRNDWQHVQNLMCAYGAVNRDVIVKDLQLEPSQKSQRAASMASSIRAADNDSRDKPDGSVRSVLDTYKLGN